MSVKKQIILIPYWVQEILRRNKLDLSVCLDLKQLKAIMSLSDLAGFVALGDHLGMLTGIQDATIGDTFWAWSKSTAVNDTETRAFHDMVCTLARDTTVQADLCARLFDEGARQPHYEKAFDIYDLTPEFAGVVVYPGFFGKSGNLQLHFPLVEAMLKALYVYIPYSEVAKTALFKRYLELLSAK